MTGRCARNDGQRKRLFFFSWSRNNFFLLPLLTLYIRRFSLQFLSAACHSQFSSISLISILSSSHNGFRKRYVSPYRQRHLSCPAPAASSRRYSLLAALPALPSASGACERTLERAALRRPIPGLVCARWQVCDGGEGQRGDAADPASFHCCRESSCALLTQLCRRFQEGCQPLQGTIN